MSPLALHVTEPTFCEPVAGRNSRIDHTIVTKQAEVKRSAVLHKVAAMVQKVHIQRLLDHRPSQTVLQYEMKTVAENSKESHVSKRLLNDFLLRGYKRHEVLGEH